MKHTIIAFAALVIVAVYSLFTFLYVSAFTSDMLEFTAAEATVTDTNDMSAIRSTFEKKKKVLSFVINKEHLNEVENHIIQLENAAEYKDTQNAQQALKLLHSAIEEIRYHNRCII